jgi:hypothetical protein
MRPGLILIGGLLAAALAYGGVYLATKARPQPSSQSQEPELAWLKAEFHIEDAEFARISQLHASYLTGCAERCRIIDQKNLELRRLLAETNTLTSEIEKTILAAAQLRAECQRQMLQHFYEVSRTMPPEQGRRYLAWVHDQTIPTDTHSAMHPPDKSPSAHGHH